MLRRLFGANFIVMLFLAIVAAILIWIVLRQASLAQHADSLEYDLALNAAFLMLGYAGTALAAFFTLRIVNRRRDAEIWTGAREYVLDTYAQRIQKFVVCTKAVDNVDAAPETRRAATFSEASDVLRGFLRVILVNGGAGPASALPSGILLKQNKLLMELHAAEIEFSVMAQELLYLLDRDTPDHRFSFRARTLLRDIGDSLTKTRAMIVREA